MNKTMIKESIKKSFSRDRVICRIIAAWCTFVAMNAFGEGKFYELEFLQDTSLSDALGINLLFFLILSVVNYYLNKYETDSWVMMASATVCVARWLLEYRVESNGALVMLGILVAYLLFAFYFVHVNEKLLDRFKIGKRAMWIIVAALGVLSMGFIAAVTCLRHMTFATPNFDFGLFVNMFHHMKETGLPIVSCERDVLLSHFVVHISPIYYLMLPAYYIFPSPYTIQICQAVAVASGIIPAVLLCRHFKLSGKATVAVAFMYALYPAFSGGCFYDVHENCFLAPLLLWMFYFFERKTWYLMYIFAFLTLMVKEDAAIYIILFAVFVIFSKKKYLHGIVLTAMSVAYFLFALWALSEMSTYFGEFYAEATPSPEINGPMVNRFNNLIFNSEDGLMGAVRTALLNPGYLLTQLFSESDGGLDKVVYVLQLFLPLGLIPFVTKKASRWLLLVPVLMNTLTMYIYQYDIGFQYSFGIGAFLIYAVIMNLPEIKPDLSKRLITLALASTFCMYAFFVAPSLSSYLTRWEKGKTVYTEMEEFLEIIPDDASVAASGMLLSHIAERDEIYQTKYHGYVADTEYVVLDLRYTEEQVRRRSYERIGYEEFAVLEGKILIMKLASE